MLIDCIARREARNRCAAKRRVVVPALEVIAGSRCRRQRDIRVKHGITRHHVRVGRRMACGCAVIQGICDRIVVGRTPLCIKSLSCRIHGRETCDRRTGEGSIVVPALKGIAVPACRQEVDVAAAVCQYRVACEISGRIGRRVPRGRAVIQHVVNRVAVRRRTPLCIVLLVLCVHGVKRRDRGTAEPRVIVPTEEGITGTRCRLNCDIRIQHRIVCDRVRVRCRVTRRCTVV